MLAVRFMHVANTELSLHKDLNSNSYETRNFSAGFVCIVLDHNSTGGGGGLNGWPLVGELFLRVPCDECLKFSRAGGCPVGGQGYSGFCRF